MVVAVVGIVEDCMEVEAEVVVDVKVVSPSANTEKLLGLTSGCFPSAKRGFSAKEAPGRRLAGWRVDIALLKPDNVVNGWREDTDFFFEEIELERNNASAAAIASRAAVLEALRLSRLVGLSNTGLYGKMMGDGVEIVFSGRRDRGVVRVVIGPGCGFACLWNF